MREHHLPLDAAKAFPKEVWEGSLLAQRAPSCAEFSENLWSFPHHGVMEAILYLCSCTYLGRFSINRFHFAFPVHIILFKAPSPGWPVCGNHDFASLYGMDLISS